jgi:outer membrane protein TolC
VELALESNPAYQASQADGKAAAAGLREARSAFLPRLSVAESFERSNDPVFAFGTKLRQQRFGLSDFALDTLNSPSPMSNFHTQLNAQWTVFDFGQTRARADRARHLRQAADHQVERAGQELIARVVHAYYNLLLAKRQQEVADQAVRTAEAILDQTRARVEAELAVESDRLNAEVALATRQQEKIRVDNNNEIARALLNHELGAPMGTRFEPVEALTKTVSPAAPAEEWEQIALSNRPDLLGLFAQEAAQEKQVSGARAAFAPRVQLLGSWEAHNQAFLANGGTNWLAAVRIELDLFDGGARRARLSRAQAEKDRLSSLRRQAESGVRLEARRAYLDLDATTRQVEVARAAITQAEESFRIIQNRYGAGLTTITDLLRAEEATTRTRTRYWESVYRYNTGLVQLELAAGVLTPATSSILHKGATP